jgi:SEC-C motif domain protein
MHPLPDDPKQLEAYCLPFLRKTQTPTTAVELMASRYVAYALAEIDYLIETHEPSTRDEIDREAVEAWANGSRFHGLQIVNTRDGGPNDDTGEVEFVALYTSEGREHRHHERSTFRRIDGRWYFSQSRMVQAPVQRATPKVGRNEPCPCGSGKKHKKCHGAG